MSDVKGEVIEIKMKQPANDDGTFSHAFQTKFNNQIIDWTMNKVIQAEKNIDSMVEQYTKDNPDKDDYHVIRNQSEPAKLVGPQPEIKIDFADNVYDLKITITQKLKLGYQVEILEKKADPNKDQMQTPAKDDNTVESSKKDVSSKVGMLGKQQWVPIVELEINDVFEDEYFISLSDVLGLIQSEYKEFYNNITTITVTDSGGGDS